MRALRNVLENPHKYQCKGRVISQTKATISNDQIDHPITHKIIEKWTYWTLNCHWWSPLVRLKGNSVLQFVTLHVISHHSYSILHHLSVSFPQFNKDTLFTNMPNALFHRFPTSNPQRQLHWAAVFGLRSSSSPTNKHTLVSSTTHDEEDPNTIGLFRECTVSRNPKGLKENGLPRWFPFFLPVAPENYNMLSLKQGTSLSEIYRHIITSKIPCKFLFPAILSKLFCKGAF